MRALRGRIRLTVLTALAVLWAAFGAAQTLPYERTFHQPKAQVEKALKQLQTSMSGRLPILDGFATAGEHPLSRYQRGYYQAAVQVSSTTVGTVVRVNTKITAWYSDQSRSGYQVLKSNGRIEGDLLDRLTEQLVSTPGAVETSLPTSAGHDSGGPAVASSHSAGEAEISAPLPQTPNRNGVLSSALKTGVSGAELSNAKPNKGSELENQVASLEEALKNQAHPKNIVAVKKSGTPVVATPSLSGKTLFLASMHDEFELLDFNQDWVHVRISGLSRGWIWRDSLELPDGIGENPQMAMGPAPAADLFQVTREEDGPFPGDWQPLRGKYVKIISVQEVREAAKNPGPAAKLEFAKFVLDKNFGELARKPDQLFGIVLIFDSVDGGMIAATFASLERWKSGKLSDAALWHQCFFDPPETFTVSRSTGGN